MQPRTGLSEGWRATALGPGPPPTLLRVRELASPFFAKRTQMSFAGLGNPPQSPPGRALRCALVGGYMRREERALRGGCGLAIAPLRGSLRRPLSVPFHTSPLSRGALRSAGVPTIAASTTPAPLLPWRSRRVPRGIWEDSVQAQGNTPCAPRGGLCGCLAVRQTFSKPPGVPTGWGRRTAEPPGRASSWGA